MSTKEKIIDYAIRYFNEHGYGAASLQQLAQGLGISRGNLTYHFRSKTALLKAIVAQMWQQLEGLRARSREFPSFENLQREIRAFQQFQQQYAFIFLDAKVFLVPQIRTQLQALRQESIQHYMNTILFSIRMGNMQPEPVPGIYYNLCSLLWMLSFSWISQQMLLQEGEATGWEKLMWSMLLPHFTPKGIAAFRKYFGEAYYQSLGKSFEQYQQEMLKI